MKDFNRVALVSGAAQGIGFACAEALSNDGAFVILADLNKDAVHQAAKKNRQVRDRYLCRHERRRSNS